MSEAFAGLPARFRAELAGSPDLGTRDRVVVALSGGLDSVVLLHLLRFQAHAAGLDVVVAHFDHAMRPASGDDARWVTGLCRAWGVPLTLGRAQVTLSSEEAAREARYEFLEGVRRDVGAALVLTAHHADDQAETVLFRLLRGTGEVGLAGIAPRRDPALRRPLLGFWRDELAAYAAQARLRWREDPTNRDVRYARNALRTHVLPEIERLVAPGARRALVRLAEHAREAEAGWRSVLPALMAPLDVRTVAGRVSIDREALLRLHAAVRARVLRTLAADSGARLDEAATRRALEFVASGASGRRVELGGSWTLTRELDRLVLAVDAAHPTDRPLRIPDPGPGAGDALLAGRTVPVRWSDGPFGTHPRVEAFDAGPLRFPLVVRARAPGDRIRLAGGSRKVKDVLLDRRIPHTLRGSLPLVVDAEGDVLWIPAVARAASVAAGRPDGARCWIGIG